MSRLIENQNRFKDLVTTYIKRDGISDLLRWLEEETDFFTAPASTKYHLAEEGGLLQHSLNVYDRFMKLIYAEYGDNENYIFENITLESIAIIALFHDICKANYYKVSERNAKNEQTGKWEKVPFYLVDEDLFFGHGSKSVYLLQHFMPLSSEEAIAIRYHMGGLEYPGTNFVEPGLTQVYNKHPLTLLIHLADMQACYLDEVFKDDK